MVVVNHLASGEQLARVELEGGRRPVPEGGGAPSSFVERFRALVLLPPLWYMYVKVSLKPCRGPAQPVGLAAGASGSGARAACQRAVWRPGQRAKPTHPFPAGALGRDWDDVEARFNKKRRVLTISVQLGLPEGGAGAGPAPAEAPAPPAAEAPPADSAGGTPNGLLAGGAPGAPRDEDELSEQSFQSATEGQALGDEEGAASPLDSPSHPPVSPDGVCEAAGRSGGGKPGAGGESPAALPPGRATPNTPPHAHEPGPSPAAAAAALREDEEAAADQAQQQAGAEAGEGSDEPGEPAAVGTKKKRRKPKKKKSKAGAAAAGGEAEAEEDADVEAAGEAAGTEGSAEAQEPDSPAEQQQQQEAAGGEGEAEGLASEGEGSQPEAAAAAAAEQQSQESCAAAGSAGQGIWSSEPAGEWGPLAGPAVRGELAKQKSSGKGEDQWLVKPQNGWSLEGLPGGWQG